VRPTQRSLLLGTVLSFFSAGAICAQTAEAPAPDPSVVTPVASTAPAEVPAQATPVQATPTNPLDQEPPGGKRVFGVLPNYRTASADMEGGTITAKQKLTIAAKDSFDYPS